MDTILDLFFLLLIFGSIISIAYSSYRDYRQATITEKRQTVRRLVAAAEQTFTRPGAGNERFTYVISKLLQLYPKTDYDDLAELIEAAVYEMKQERKAPTL